MAGLKWTVEEEKALFEGYRDGVPLHQIAKKIGRSRHAVKNHGNQLGYTFGFGVGENRGATMSAPKAFTVERPPTVNRSPEQTILEQARHYREKKERWESKHQGIRIEIHEEGPYGILCFGDTHGDDDGFDFDKFCFDLQLVKDTPHLFGAHLGDLTNNWIGRLSHLWGVQHVTTDEAIGIADWMVNAIPWLFVILGNHDKWRNEAEILCKKAGVQHVSHGGRFNIHCGESVLKMEARHDHPGRSMYNPAHGQLKKNHRGSDCDVIIGAHTHNSAYTLLKNGVTGQIGHAIRVGAYKRYEEFADQLGLEDESLSPSVLLVVDPGASPEGFVTVWHDTGKGAEYLSFLRSKSDGGKKDGRSSRVPRGPSAHGDDRGRRVRGGGSLRARRD